MPNIKKPSSLRKRLTARRVITTIRPSIVNGRHNNSSLLLTSNTSINQAVKTIRAVKRNNKTLAKALQVLRLEHRMQEDLVLDLKTKNMELQLKLSDKKFKMKEKLESIKSGLEQTVRSFLQQAQIIGETMHLCQNEEESKDEVSFESYTPLSTPLKQDVCQEKDEKNMNEEDNMNDEDGINNEEGDAVSEFINDEQLNDKVDSSSSEFDAVDMSLSEKFIERTPFDMTVIDEEQVLSDNVKHEMEDTFKGTTSKSKSTLLNTASEKETADDSQNNLDISKNQSAIGTSELAKYPCAKITQRKRKPRKKKKAKLTSNIDPSESDTDITGKDLTADKVTIDETLYNRPDHSFNTESDVLQTKIRPDIMENGDDTTDKDLCLSFDKSKIKTFNDRTCQSLSMEIDVLPTEIKSENAFSPSNCSPDISWNIVEHDKENTYHSRQISLTLLNIDQKDKDKFMEHREENGSFNDLPSPIYPVKSKASPFTPRQSTRSSRRAKAVSLKEPSLRKKLRR